VHLGADSRRVGGQRDGQMRWASLHVSGHRPSQKGKPVRGLPRQDGLISRRPGGVAGAQVQVLPRATRMFSRAGGSQGWWGSGGISPNRTGLVVDERSKSRDGEVGDQVSVARAWGWGYLVLASRLSDGLGWSRLGSQQCGDDPVVPAATVNT